MQVFHQMSTLNIPCHPHLLTELLTIMCTTGMYDKALEIFDTSIAAGMEPTVHNFSPLLKNCGSAVKARAILQRMEHAGLVPNVISYTAAIKSCEPTGDLNSALMIMDFMRGCGVIPNEVTYCCIISVASRGMQGIVAANMLREMSHYGFAPNQICYGSALTACARCGMWEEVQRLLQEMEELGLPLQESVLISVINVCRISIILQRDMAVGEFLMAPMAPIEVKGELDEDAAVTGQWNRALWLVNNWASKVENLSESVFTMAMDVCESARQDVEVIRLFRSIKTHGVKPSKSAHAYALRACCRSLNVDDAIDIVRSAELAGVCNLNMYNVTLTLSESLGRTDMSISILRKMQESYFIYSQSNKFGERNYKNFISKKVLSTSLDQLTRNFTKSFTEVKQGRLAPGPESLQFVQDITEVLVTSVTDKHFNLAPSTYPMANKLLLDGGYYAELRTLLNTSLYNPAVNSSRLYEFATRSLISFAKNPNPDLRVGVEWILSLMDDIKAAGYYGLCQSILMLALGRLESWHEGALDSPTRGHQSTSSAPSVSSPGKFALAEDLGYLDDLKLRQHKRDPQSIVAEARGNTTSTIRRVLIYELFMEGRDILGNKNLPIKAYEIAAAACRDGRLAELMLEVYRRSIDDGKVSKLIQFMAIDTCARSRDYYELALSTFEEVLDKDERIYNAAILACETGKDWEHALFLLESMQKKGLKLNTIVITTAIAACASSGRFDEALGLLKMMKTKGIRRNIYTYTAAISSCAPEGRWKEALAMFELMQEDDGALSSEISGENEYVAVDELEGAVDTENAGNDEEEEEDEGEEEDDEEEEDDPDVGIDIFATRKVPPNIRLYNTLIEALRSQELMVDNLYAQGVENGIIKPFAANMLDLHAHSLNMAKAAVRYALNAMLSPGQQQNVTKDLVIIVGRGKSLGMGIKTQLLHDFHPTIRSYISETNAGRLRVNAKDLQHWIQLNRIGDSEDSVAL